MNATDCMEVFWGSENQFNAILSLDQAEAETFATARTTGARWPLPITLNFTTPTGHDGAVLKFGGHEVALNLRGMAGPPAVDYAAYYPQAAPGSVLYDSGSKTVVVDSIDHDPDGGIQLSMTASNNSEAEDFGPVIIPDAVFSTGGRVDVSMGQRIFIAETLAPGQSASIEYTVRRGGDGTWGYVTYSGDPAKRPDAVIIRMADSFSLDGAPMGDSGSFAPFMESAKLEHDPRGSFPVFVRFQRSEDEGEFWQVKMLWRLPVRALLPIITPDGTGYLSRDGAVQAFDVATGELKWDYVSGTGRTSPREVSQGIVCATEGNRVLILDAETGEVRWRFDFVGSDNSLSFLHRGQCTVADGKVFADDDKLYALNAATGEQLWDYDYDGAELPGLTLADGQVYVSRDGYRSRTLVALDAATGEEIWQSKNYRGINDFHIADDIVCVAFRSSVSNFLHALDAATGEGIWSKPKTVGGRQQCTVLDGMVYEYGESRIAAHDARTGETVWERRLDRGFRTYVYKGPDGMVYGIGRQEGEYTLFALDAGTGEQIWSHAGSRFHGFDLADGVMLLSTPDGEIHSVDASTGESIWNSGVNASGDWDATVANGVAFLSTDQYLYAFLATEE